VAANSELRTRLKMLCDERDIELLMPPIEYCTDNAAMIGIAGYYAYKRGIRGSLSLNAISSIALDK
jgi:N6-L-threonylcarbamoyladenine synthase